MTNQSSILIIDDDHELASMLQSIFSHKGYKTLVAHSAAQVASLLAQNNEQTPWPVSLILLDLMMPQVDGGELYGWLRAHPKTTDTPIIVLSAIDSIEKRVELLNKGADDYIVKPCPVEELLARVSIHIQLYELRQARQAAETRSNLQANFINAVHLIGQYLAQPTNELQPKLSKAARAVVQHFLCENCIIYLQTETEKMMIGGRFPAEFTPPASHIPFLKRITLQRETVTSGLSVGLPILHGHSLIGGMVVQVKDLTRLQSLLTQGLAIVAQQIASAVTYHYLTQSFQQQKQANRTADASLPTTSKTHNTDTVEPLQLVQNYLQLLTEFDMEREKQIDYLKLAHSEITNFLNNSN
ncbi:MAG: response regulator transcription factor [Anaerolineales bacterium]|nr:response regulator transcription factor [Anaerolineales bacterium]